MPSDSMVISTGVVLTLIERPICTDTFTNLTRIDGDESSDPAVNSTYLWSEKNIAWPGEARKYVTKPGYDAADIVPPPFWMERFPNGYTDDNLPDLKNDEHFQNWMRTAGLPTFSKLWGRNDGSALAKGRYEMWINLSECTFCAERRCRAVTGRVRAYYRLPGDEVQGYEEHRDLVGGVDGRQEPLPRVGVRRRLWAPAPSRLRRRHCQLHQAQVCLPRARLNIVTNVVRVRRKLGDATKLSFTR